MTLFAEILEAISMYSTNTPDGEDCFRTAVAVYELVCDSFPELDRDIRS